MRRMLVAFLVIALLSALPGWVGATPVSGTYYSAFRGGAVLNGHVSVSRQFPNSGNPKIFHGQSWTGSALGTQWEIRCGVELTSVPPDSTHFNKVTGTGVIVYNQTFQGGTFSLYFDAAVGWGSGSGTLFTTVATTQVAFVNFVPVGSSFTAYTSGAFGPPDANCQLTFAMANGFGDGETPYFQKPITYPTFLAADCSPADANHQFGIWAHANDIIAQIFCSTPVQDETWGRIKALYR